MEARCPPHHWQISQLRIDGWPHDHHLCLRCGAEKDRPTGDSASMYWDRAATPQAAALYHGSHKRAARAPAA